MSKISIFQSTTKESRGNVSDRHTILKTNTWEAALRVIISLIFIWELILSSGCQSNPVQAGTPFEMTSNPIPLSPTEGDAQMTPSQSISADPALQGLIEVAKADLAQRLKILATQISLIEAKSVIWPDSSLGCPQPGMRYKQVQEDGALIILQVQGVVYEYHIGGTRGLFLCEKNSKDADPPPQIDITNLTPPSRDKNDLPPVTPANSTSPGEDQ